MDPNWQGHLMTLIESVMQIPGYCSVPRSIFEVGCGAGGFVVSALRAGHDAWGLDNDDERLELGRERIDALSLDPGWKQRLLKGDASDTRIDPNRFDLVIGHQFIEHVPNPASTIFELLRVTKPGGYVVLFAPDYRAPFEAHYEIPWPPFLPRELCKVWLDGFGRPHGGLDDFYYVTVEQLVGIVLPLNCRIVNAYNDRKVEPQVMRHFDCSTPQTTFETAKKFRTAFEARSLPENFMIATSLGIVVQKL
jgi:ubiquinone/menaquinone biosynthesis C-methylase UbiE